MYDPYTQLKFRETENEDLTSVMQKIVCTYTEQLVPVAVDICQHLVGTFAQVVNIHFKHRVLSSFSVSIKSLIQPATAQYFGINDICNAFILFLFY